MEETLRKAGEIALQAVQASGLKGEAFLLHNRELSIEVSGGQVETLKEAEQAGLGLRVFNQGRLGFAYSSDLSEAAIQETARNAVHTSAFTAADEFNCLPSREESYPVMAIFDEGISQAAVATKIEMARDIERVARAFDRRINRVESSGYEDGESSILIMNSRGLYAFGRGSYCGLHISLTAGQDDDNQRGFAFDIQRASSALRPEQVGREAAMKAIRSLGATSIPSGRLPCILEPYVATKFMALLSPSLCADEVWKGKSMLADKVGQNIASRSITLSDDATCPEGMASFPFDGEGVASARKTLIEEGELGGFLYDTKSALQTGVKSTGNGMRGSFRGLPGVGTTNLLLSPGSHSPTGLIADIEKGIYVTEVMGMHTANAISGDFSVGAAGIMIEQGQMTFPVRGITIAGNLFALLQDIEAVGNDLRFFGSQASPSLRLNSIDIGGL